MPEIENSPDGTLKLRIRLDDGPQVEACLLRLSQRQVKCVVCVSSQAGCPYHCNFCRSGHRDFLRNLTAEEIVTQVERSADHAFELRSQPFDVSFMGTGEPLANTGAVAAAIGILRRRFPNIDTFNISTLLPSALLSRLAQIPADDRVHLQLSLHSPFDQERRRLLQLQGCDIRESIKALRDFAIQRNDRVCLNYLLFAGINDTHEHAQEIIRLVPADFFYVKLSTYTPIQESRLAPSEASIRLTFRRQLVAAGIVVKTFDSAGTDIAAGCGQLVTEAS
jgi:23S rRNA (adenine2503-C2)-methyltransferase